MTADFFVSKLKEQTPSESELEKLGLPRDYVGLRRRNLKLKKKGNFLLSDEVLNLVENYNAELIEIGAITFVSKNTEDKDFYHVGLMEVDPLVISKVTGEVKVIEHATDRHLLYDCAGNGALFLDAMILADDHLNKCLFVDDLFDDQDAAREIATKCSEAAGGEKYFNFYAEIVGYFGS